MHSYLHVSLHNEKELCIRFELSLDIPDVYDRKKLNQIKEPAPVLACAFDITKAKVLLVDDNATNREVILQILISLGITADTAFDGLDAFNKISANSYDLIFMDLQMPIMDGFEASHKIRTELGLTDLPIIAVTANQFNIDKEKALEEGLDDFIPKPVNAPQLKSCLEYWLGNKNKTNNSSDETKKVSDVEALEPFNMDNILDVQRFAERFGNDKAIQINIYKIFKSDFTSWYSTMVQIIEEQDWLTCERHAHTLKGASANIDANRLSDLAKRLEGLAKMEQPDREGAFILAKEISVGLEQVIRLIDDFMKSNVANDEQENIVVGIFYFAAFASY
jgi:CheY-like chemotaxis protein